MKQMEIEGMIYSPSNVVKIVINNYSSGLTKQINLGSLDIPVRIGQTADSKFCVILGDVTTSWSYPHFMLSRVMMSHSSISDAICYGWSVKLETNLTGYLNVYGEIANSPIVSNITGNAATATKLGTATVGGTVKPFYLNAGTPTAFSNTVGGISKGVYMNAGSVTAMSATVGSSTAPVYMDKGTITACGTSLGVSITGNAATATSAGSITGFTSGWSNSGEHNANNISSNGMWYYTSNGPTTAQGSSTNDGALYSQAHSTA